MAGRKQFLGAYETNPELQALLSAAAEATEDELREQRISFAYGNALGCDAITKDSVRRSASRMSVL